MCASLVELLDNYEMGLKNNIWAGATGGKCDLLKLERERTGSRISQIQLSSTDISVIASRLAALPRDLISDGYDAALEALAQLYPLSISRFPTGYEAFTWLVPEKWHCHSATLKRVNGETVFSSSDDRMHVMSYSLPFSGNVTREELFKHLHVGRANNSAAIPFVFKYYERDWGLCCSRELKDSLNDDFYEVEIDTDFSFGELKVGEWLIGDEEKKNFIFCAHLCHPCQFNDGLSGVLAGLKVMERLTMRKSLRYAYRLLLLPETIGSACWLSRNEHLFSRFIGGMFLEMLATNEVGWRLMHSNLPESYCDCLASSVFQNHSESVQETPFLQGMLNDERMFNAPGINCPMMSLMAVNHETGTFNNYHTNLDTWENASLKKLEDSVDLIMDYIFALENDYIPCPNYRGEIMVSRYSSLDYSKMGRLIRILTYGMDGKASLSAIAKASGTSFRDLFNVAEALRNEDLVKIRDIDI